MDLSQRRAAEASKKRKHADEPTCPNDIPWTSSEYELPHGIFDDDEPGEVWRAVPWRWPAKDFLVSSHGYVRTRGQRQRGNYEKKTRGSFSIGRYYTKHVQVSTLVCEAFRGFKPTPMHTCDHFYSDQTDKNSIDNLWWRTKSEQSRNQRKRAAFRTGDPIDVRKKGSSNNEWVSYASRGAACKATGVGRGTICSILRGDRNAGHKIAYEIRKGAPPESQEKILPPNDKDPEEERWSFARKRDGTFSERHRVSTRGRARQKTSAGDAWSLIYTPKPNHGQYYALLNVGYALEQFHTTVWRTFRPNDPVNYTNGESIDHIDRVMTNNALYNLRRSYPTQQTLNQVRKDRTEIKHMQKKEVWGLPANAPANAPREWLGPSTNEAAEELSRRLGERVSQAIVSKSILKGVCVRGLWYCFATPEAAADAEAEAEHRRVLVALDALPAWQE